MVRSLRFRPYFRRRTPFTKRTFFPVISAPSFSVMFSRILHLHAKSHILYHRLEFFRYHSSQFCSLFFMGDCLLLWTDCHLPFYPKSQTFFLPFWSYFFSRIVSTSYSVFYLFRWLHFIPFLLWLHFTNIFSTISCLVLFFLIAQSIVSSCFVTVSRRSVRSYTITIPFPLFSPWRFSF